MSRPQELDGVEVYNSITLATQVQISILRVSFFLTDFCFLCLVMRVASSSIFVLVFFALG